MHPAARNRGYIYNRPFGCRQFIHQTPRQDDRGEEIHMEHLSPSAQIGGQGRQTRAIWPFGADARVVHKRVQPAIDLRLNHLECRDGFVGAGKVDLDVILFAPRPRAARVKGLTRTGQHPPTFRRKPLDGGVPYASRGAGENDGFLICHGAHTSHAAPKGKMLGRGAVLP